MNRVGKVWGYEEHIINLSKEGYCGKRMVLDPGACCSMHSHPVKDETFYVSSGHMLLELSEDPRTSKVRRIHLKKGDAHRIWPGMWHRFTGGPLGCEFFEFSMHDDPADCVRLEESRPAGSVEYIPPQSGWLATRTEVYGVIDGERDYQDVLKKGPGGRTDGEIKQVGAFLSLIQHALNKAFEAYYENQGDVPALHFLRKIAAMAVQCMEIHGAPARETK